MSVAGCLCAHNRFAVPHLKMAAFKQELIKEDLMKEKNNVIKLKSSVIELQSKVIEKREEELSLLTTTAQKEMKSVQGVVQTEMKSYSASLSKTC